MSNPFQIRYLWFTVVALLLLNLGLLGWILFSPQGKGRKQPPSDLLERELNFSPVQKEQFTLLKEAHQTKTRAIRDSAMMIKRTLFNQLNEPLSDQEIENTTHLIAEKMEIVDNLTFYHFREVRQLCTPMQQQRFDEIIEDVLRHLSDRPAGNQPPPPMR